MNASLLEILLFTLLCRLWCQEGQWDKKWRYHKQV